MSLRTGSSWRYMAGIAAGPAHRMVGTPCQDAYAVEVRAGHLPGTEALLAVVADGAGSRAYSQVASRIICSTLIHEFRELLTRPSFLDIHEDQAAEWIQHCVARELKLAERMGVDPYGFACTAVGVCILPQQSIFVQVGDGAIVVHKEASLEEQWDWVFWPMRGEFDNTTMFVSPDAEEIPIQFAVIDEPIDELALFTDGIQGLALQYATQQVHLPFFKPLFEPLRDPARAGEMLELSAMLDAFLDSERVAERSDDDKAIIMASRRATGWPAS